MKAANNLRRDGHYFEPNRGLPFIKLRRELLDIGLQHAQRLTCEEAVNGEVSQCIAGVRDITNPQVGLVTMRSRMKRYRSLFQWNIPLRTHITSICPTKVPWVKLSI